MESEGTDTGKRAVETRISTCGTYGKVVLPHRKTRVIWIKRCKAEELPGALLRDEIGSV